MSDEDVINRDAALSSLPPEWKGDGNGAGDGGRAGGGVEAGLARTIAARVAGDDQTIVVLDDDPTGTQTVYDLPVLTVWSEAALDAEFGRGTPAFYVMTNSRSMGQEEAAAVGRAIAGRLRTAAARHGRRLSVISRSDSTLRGHYPLEIDVLAEALSGDSGDSGATTAANANAIDGQILVPFFLEGGRLTLDDVHYVAEGDRLVPAAQTPFARDHAFGFTRSNLRDYVEEKTGGRIGRDDVESITLDDLRTGGPTRVRAKLSALRNMCACIVNAVTMRDVQVFALGLLDAEARDGRRFLVRSAASFVQARIGLPKRPILDAGRIRSKGGGAGAHGTGAGGRANGGLVVVGSYVPKTTRQLEELLRLDGVLKVEVRGGSGRRGQTPHSHRCHPGASRGGPGVRSGCGRVHQPGPGHRSHARRKPANWKRGLRRPGLHRIPPHHPALLHNSQRWNHLQRRGNEGIGYPPRHCPRTGGAWDPRLADRRGGQVPWNELCRFPRKCWHRRCSRQAREEPVSVIDLADDCE